MGSSQTSWRALGARLDRKQKQLMFAGRERLNMAIAYIERRFAGNHETLRSKAFKRELARYAPASGGHVAMAALHLPSGEWLAVNGRSRVPMASVVKVVTAVQLLSRVDRGEVALGATVPIRREDLRPGAGTLAARPRPTEVEISVRDLLELMLTTSDNTAADMILGLAGGVDAVRAGLAKAGIADIRIDRSIGEQLADLEGIPASACTPAEWMKIVAALPVEQRRSAMLRALRDPRDTCTPEAIVRFLVAVSEGQVIARESAVVLFDAMARCKTGQQRLKGLLPDVRVAHKTGTIVAGPNDRGPRMTADAGVIELPAGRGRIAIAAFVVDSPNSGQQQDRVIARLARTVYDRFSFGF